VQIWHFAVSCVQAVSLFLYIKKKNIILEMLNDYVIRDKVPV